MKKRVITAFLLVVVVSGCYLPISGRVIDAETQQPIEGAIVLVEWTKKHCFIDCSTESYKVVESFSDKNGKFRIEGCYSPFVESPDMAIYRNGYVTWSSRNVFPSWKKRDDFQWKSGNIYRLERFLESYSHTDHQMFTNRAINDTIGWENKKTFSTIYDEAERAKIIKEQNIKDKERSRGLR